MFIACFTPLTLVIAGATLSFGREEIPALAAGN
jgi:hypothetical protein